MFKVNNKRRQWSRSGVFVISFEDVSSVYIVKSEQVIPAGKEL